MERLAQASPNRLDWQMSLAGCQVRLARAREQQDRSDEARRLYEAAAVVVRNVAKPPPVPATAISQAAWYYVSCPDPASRDLAKSVKLARRVLDLYPKNFGVAWKALGLVQLRQGNGPEAVEAFLKARANLPGGDRTTDLLLALAYDAAGQAALARQEYEQACRRLAAFPEYGEELERFRAEADGHFRPKGP
jgi:tetratricopeptide (TPR) repeat protein